MSTKAIILAAGSSRRLRPITNNRPKFLVELNKETILDYQLRCLTECRVEQILIVVGYKKEMIKEYLEKSAYKKLIKIINNDVFEKTDNAYSLSLALEEVNEKKDSVIILDGDIIFDIRLLKKIIASRDKNALIASNDRKIKPEDNKVLIKEGYAKIIKKTIKGSAIYNSIIKLNGKLLQTLKNECRKLEAWNEWYTEPLTKTLQDFPKEVKVIFTKGLLACEIDTKEDLIRARRIHAKLTKLKE